MIIDPVEVGVPQSIESVIDANLAQFRRARVLSIRPGFEIADGWLTGRPAIVVTVTRKLRNVPADEQLPDEVDGIPVDVRQASGRKRLALGNPAAFARELRLTPDAGALPFFADERTVDGGPVASIASLADPFAAAATAKPQLAYTAPPSVALAPITAAATIQLCAGPDAAWPVLSAFLTATRQSLVVGLYDFTAAHVLDTLEQALAGKKLTLTLDHPALDRTADQTDAATVAALVQSLGPDLTQAWALTKPDPEATAWIFPTAYHIKVAVRDSSSTWLSSGNWNNSNQADIDPAAKGLKSPDADQARYRDRDWHVVVDQPELAAVFEAYLLHDQSIAAAHNGPPAVPGAPLPAPPLPPDETPKFSHFYAPLTIDGDITIAPLLTPDADGYAAPVRTLIESATETLYLQFQYIELPKTITAAAQPFVDLVDAVIARQQAGVDVRIIMSEYETAGYLEQLQARGLDVVSSVKIQNNVHNKGIVVDDRAVLVSSQNWSTDGTTLNRDAGLIIYDARAATYFRTIFLHDWQHLAKKAARSD